VTPDSIEEIRTTRLVLQPLDPPDAAEMVDVLADPLLYEFTGGEAPDFDTLERRYRIRSTDRPPAKKTGTTGSLARLRTSRLWGSSRQR
jgi:hypothetical protein